MPHLCERPKLPTLVTNIRDLGFVELDQLYMLLPKLSNTGFTAVYS